MSDAMLAPLLEIQSLDLSVRAAEIRLRDLPARGVLDSLYQEIAVAEAELAKVIAENATVQTEERAVGESVARLAQEIESAELERYSGTQKSRDQALAHDEAQAERRARQTELEDLQMTLLESIEQGLERAREIRDRMETARTGADRMSAQIWKVESEVAEEIAEAVAARNELIPKIPVDVLTAYEHVRTEKRAAGRGAAPLSAGDCGSCRIKLPSLDYHRMVQAEEGTLLRCPQCRRVLVRV